MNNKQVQKQQQNTQNNNNQPHPQQQQLQRPLMHQPSFVQHPQQSSMRYGAPPQPIGGVPHNMQRNVSIGPGGAGANNMMAQHRQGPPPPGQQYNMPPGRGPPPMPPQQQNIRGPTPMMLHQPSIQPQSSMTQYRPVPQSALATHHQQIPERTTTRTGKIQKTVADPIHQEPKLQNLVSTANLNTDLQLKDIAYKCKNAEYNPRRFAAVIMRMKEPARTTALIFKTGKMVITGAKSETLSKDAAKAYAKAIQKVGYPNVKMTEFKVQNMVGSCSVDFKIKLESLFHSNHQQFCVFNPDTFPGLIYHMAVPKVCLLIFSSGKIVLTGAKQRQDIDKAFEQIIPLLRKFVKNPTRDMDEKKD